MDHSLTLEVIRLGAMIGAAICVFALIALAD